VDGHVNDWATDKDSQVLSDVFDIKGEEVWQDQEEYADRSQLNKESDDLHHDILNFLDGTKQRGVRSLDQASDHNSRYEDGQKFIVGQGRGNVVRDERLKDLYDDIVGCHTASFGDVFCFFLGHCERSTVSDRHQRPPDKIDKDGADYDGKNRCAHIPQDGKASQLSATFLHVHQVLHGKDHGNDD
jgi:hypothetical protein